MDLLGKIQNLREDIRKSNDYNTGSTARAIRMANEIIRVLNDTQRKTMNGGLNPAGRVLTNMMGASGSPFIKNRITIIADINGIKRDVSNAKTVNSQLTSFINSRLEMMKK